MVDISTDNRKTGIFSFGDCDPDAWLTCIVQSTKLGRSSSMALSERLQLLINNTPKMMKKAYEAACKDYAIKLARFKAWDQVAEEAKYQEALKNHNESRRLVSSLDLAEYDNNAPRPPRSPVEPMTPVPPVADFSDVCLSTRFAWLQYIDFEDAGIEVIEIIAAPPSCTRGHALSVE